MSCANVNVVYLQIALNKDYIDIYDYLHCSIVVLLGVRDYDLGFRVAVSYSAAAYSFI